MNLQEQNKYKDQLLKEKARVNDVIAKLKQNEVINSNAEIASEISYYDNHTADLGEELFDKEKGLAIKANEYDIINKIDDALKSIDQGTYGICKECHKEISSERLDVIPYAAYCVPCQNKINSIQIAKSEEENDLLIDKAFSYGFNDKKYSAGYDGEDILQAADSANWIDGIEEYDDDDTGYVESIESISNEQYRKQLPD